MHVKPKAGLLVRDPVTHAYLPPEGREVEDSAYWHRRLRDGDVELIPPAASPPEPAAAQAPEPAPAKPHRRVKE